MAAEREPPTTKHYFVKTDPLTFLPVHQWLTRSRADNTLQITGYRAISANFIEGNDGKRWTRIYDFSRTTLSVMRYHMLVATDLLQLSRPKLGGSNNLLHIDAKGRPDPLYSISINEHYHLAANENEAEWVTAHFDMLFPHCRIKKRLEGIQDGQTASLRDEMIIVDHTCKMEQILYIELL